MKIVEKWTKSRIRKPMKFIEYERTCGSLRSENFALWKCSTRPKKKLAEKGKMKTDKVQIQNFYNLEIVWVVSTISLQLSFFLFVRLDIGIFLNDAYNIDSNFYANFYSGYYSNCLLHTLSLLFIHGECRIKHMNTFEYLTEKCFNLF